MTVHHVGARPQLAFKTPTISLRTVMQSQEHALACSYLHSYLAIGHSRGLCCKDDRRRWEDGDKLDPISFMRRYRKER